MAECSILDCPKPVLARGWCNRHYANWRRCGDPDRNRGGPKTPEHRAKLAAHLARVRVGWPVGKKHSMETREKLAMARRQPDPLVRFWTKVEKTDTCWVWKGSRHKQGYGYFVIGSRVDGSRKIALAHRWIWEQINGPIPDGLNLLHTCDNPPCVNYVEHLYLGTQSDNMRDREARGRANRR